MTPRRFARLVLVSSLAGLAGLAGLPAAGEAQAQERLPVGTHVGTGAAAPAPAGAPSVYEETGRRDPFVSLLASKKSVAPASTRPKAGLAGIALADITVRGVVQNGTTVVAVLEGPGGKSFVARSKDRLQDATVKAIDPDGVTFSTQVVDALGVSRARDIRKSLRQTAAEDPR